MLPPTFLFGSAGRSWAAWHWGVSLRFQESPCRILTMCCRRRGQVSRAGDMYVPWPCEALGQPGVNMRVTHS